MQLKMHTWEGASVIKLHCSAVELKLVHQILFVFTDTDVSI